MAPGRIDRLKQAVQESRPGVCTERALIWTRYFRTPENRRKPPLIQMAEALREVLLQKTIRIYPDELLVGNFSSKRVGGSIYPELHGLVVLQDLLRFSKRKPARFKSPEKRSPNFSRSLPSGCSNFWDQGLSVQAPNVAFHRRSAHGPNLFHQRKRRHRPYRARL